MLKPSKYFSEQKWMLFLCGLGASKETSESVLGLFTSGNYYSQITCVFELFSDLFGSFTAGFGHRFEHKLLTNTCLLAFILWR